MAIDCTNPHISMQELLNSLLVKDDAGNIGLRVKRVSAAAADITQVVGCAEFNLGPEMILRHAIGLSDDGKAALILIEEA
jgi:hypothetical protein